MAFVRNFENGQLVTSGDRQFVEDEEAIGRGAVYRLKMFRGEYFLDITDGTPWFQAILGKSADDQAEVLLKRRLLTAPGVAGIANFSYEPDPAQRSLTVTADVVTNEGNTIAVNLDEDII